MAFFHPWLPYVRNQESLADLFEDHPFLNFNSSFFRDANVSRNNRANVSETESQYKIEVEVPGYSKDEINIEFGPDGKSVTVSGRTEKSYEEAPEAEGPKSVTVEEAPEEGEQQKGASTSTEVAQKSTEKSVGAPAGPKYWISERSVGSFTRTFPFRSALDPEKATANLEHGVLTIVVPKATKHTVKKIAIA